MSEVISNDEKYPKDAKLLDIVTYPDPVLKKIASSVTEFGPELETLCQNMLKTMYHAPGIGLAAPQIGISKRIFVLDVDYNREPLDDEANRHEISDLNPRIFINPVLKDPEGQTTYQEGCLSVPEVFDDVQRHEKITVEYQDVNGNKHEETVEGLLSICIQHENDHLDGIVFIEKLSSLKLNYYRKKLIKEKKRTFSVPDND